MKKILVMIMVVLLLASCNDNPSDNRGDTDSSTGNDIGGSSLKDKPFTLIMPQASQINISSSKTDANGNIVEVILTEATKAHIDAVEAQLNEQGFNINIDIVPLKGPDDYKSYVKTKLGEDKNVAFFKDEFSRDEIKVMADSGQIMEISDAFNSHAPRYYFNVFKEDTARKNYIKSNLLNYIVDGKDTDKIYGIPVGQLQIFDYSVLLVKTEISRKYGKDIDSLDDYKNLLKWIKDNYPQYRPGLFPINVYQSSFTSSKPCSDFWAHVNGYSDISELVGAIDTSSCYYKNRDIAQIVEDGSLGIVEAAQLPDFREFLFKLREWSNNGLVEFWTNRNLGHIDPTAYATIVTNIFGYTRPEFVNIQSALADAGEYDMYLFNKAAMQYSTGRVVYPVSSAIHIGGNSENHRILLGFIDWLYSEQENYNSFIYGKKDIDYTMNDGRISFSEKDGRAAWGEMQFARFEDFKFSAKKAFHPDNWEAILAEISEVPHYDEISLSNYVLKKNQKLDVYAIEKLHDSFINNDNGKKDRMEYDIKTGKYLEKVLVTETGDPEAVIDEYFGYAATAPDANNQKQSYQGLVDELFKRLEDSEE